jgi:hypothetical protein
MEEHYMTILDDMKHLEEECNEVLKPKLEQKEKQCQVNYIM